MKVKIDYDLCQGHGVCMSEAPEVFRVEDDGSLTVLAEEPEASLHAKVENAARYCPTGAISLDRTGDGR